jgi:hypothetical protein
MPTFEVTIVDSAGQRATISYTPPDPVAAPAGPVGPPFQAIDVAAGGIGPAELVGAPAATGGTPTMLPAGIAEGADVGALTVELI